MKLLKGTSRTHPRGGLSEVIMGRISPSDRLTTHSTLLIDILIDCVVKLFKYSKNNNSHSELSSSTENLKKY